MYVHMYACMYVRVYKHACGGVAEASALPPPRSAGGVLLAAAHGRGADEEKASRKLESEPRLTNW